MFEQLRDQFRQQLQHDRTKEVRSEVARIMDLERKLVDEHGLAAIQLIFEKESGGNYFALGDFPADCPWAGLNGMDRTAAIKTVFAPLAEDVPTLIAAIVERCSHLYVERQQGAWRLHYFCDMQLYDGRRYYHVYTGGPPNPRPQPNASLTNHGWPLPPDLARLYAVHDGFGPIHSSEEINVMADMMDPICQAQKTAPEGYEFRDLLEFHPDGCGNAQCFYRQAGEFPTVDWDHELWQISGGEDFFAYVDDRLSELDEE